MSDDQAQSGEWPAPRKNPELVGHDDAEAQFLGAHASGRLAHAWLIAGPRGIGKATFAFRCARALLAGALDAEPPTLALPASDPVFRRVAAKSHAGLATVQRGIHPKTGRRQTQIVVESVRALLPFFGQTAGESGWRVALIDGAETMTGAAANALLKILEEPPDKGLLLLVSHTLGRLPPTIRSRCRYLPLRPLATSDVAAILERWFPGLGADERAILARLSDGSVGRALTLAATGGLAALRELLDLLARLPALDHGALHALGDRLSRPSNEASYRMLTETLSWWLARMIRDAAAGTIPDPSQEAIPGEAAVMERLGAVTTLDRWVEVWEKIDELLARSDLLNLDKKQVILSVFATLEHVARGASRTSRAA